MTRWRRIAALVALSASGFVLGEASDATAARTPAEPDTPPELAALEADSSEEQTVRRLQELGTEKQRLLARAEQNGRVYVRLVRLGMLPLSGGFDAFVAHMNRVEALRRGLARDLARAAELDVEAQDLRSGLKQLRARRDRMIQQATDYQRSRAAVLAAREREAAYQRAFEARGKTRPHTAVYASNNEVDGAASFAELKGHLPFPVEGRAEVRELEPNAERGPAVEMLVELGAVARAVFKGRVVLVGESDGGTHVVVVDHGSGYTTLTANLQRVLVEVGDKVAGGAVLGELARGDADRATLHFEVRLDGRSLLPAEWFGI